MQEYFFGETTRRTTRCGGHFQGPSAEGAKKFEIAGDD
jgi:hypothetical protein